MSDRCHAAVPLSPPAGCRFHFLFKTRAGGFWGRITLVGDSCCPCQSGGVDAPVCLLHSGTPPRPPHHNPPPPEALLCSQDSGFLSRSKVCRWFHGSVMQAWDQISHRYEFQLHRTRLGPPGGFLVRFHSGKRLGFMLTPEVELSSFAHFTLNQDLDPLRSLSPRYEDLDPLRSLSPRYEDLDPLWSLSLSGYEDALLERLSEGLPEDSCHLLVLDLACFLLRSQTRLCGRSLLNRSHFKAALVHLLQTRGPSQWERDLAAPRLRDLLHLMETSLQQRNLTRVLDPDLPAQLRAKPENLLQALVEEEGNYRSTVRSFREVLRNAKTLIEDYVSDPD